VLPAIGIAALRAELRDGEGQRLPSSGTMTRRGQGALALQKETRKNKKNKNINNKKK
jgi:hypothetical protein